MIEQTLTRNSSHSDRPEPKETKSCLQTKAAAKFATLTRATVIAVNAFESRGETTLLATQTGNLALQRLKCARDAAFAVWDLWWESKSNHENNEWWVYSTEDEKGCQSKQKTACRM